MTKIKFKVLCTRFGFLFHIMFLVSFSNVVPDLLVDTLKISFTQQHCNIIRFSREESKMCFLSTRHIFVSPHAHAQFRTEGCPKGV